MTSVRAAAELPEGTIGIVTAIADQITQQGGRAFACVADVTDPASIERLVQDTVATHCRVDIAFNNAGQGHQPKPLADLSVEEFDRTLSASARGMFLSMKYEIAAMLENDPPGAAIVQVAFGVLGEQTSAWFGALPGLGALVVSGAAVNLAHRIQTSHRPVHHPTTEPYDRHARHRAVLHRPRSDPPRRPRV